MYQMLKALLRGLRKPPQQPRLNQPPDESRSPTHRAHGLPGGVSAATQVTTQEPTGPDSPNSLLWSPIPSGSTQEALFFSPDSSQDSIRNLLETFTSYDRCFPLREVSDWADGDVDVEELRRVFAGDGRFLLLSESGWGPELFLPKRTLFGWWVSFNKKLAIIGKSRLSSTNLTGSLNSLRFEGRWFNPPKGLLEYGERFGLVASAWSSGSFVFPLAQIGQHLPIPSARIVTANYFSDKFRETPPQPRHSQVIDNVFKTLEERESYVLSQRFGLHTGQPVTLEAVGTTLGVTRERVRQIQARGLRKLRHPVRTHQVYSACVDQVIRSRGSLLVESGSTEYRYWDLARAIIGIPIADLNVDNLAVIGASVPSDKPLGHTLPLFQGLDPEAVAQELDKRELDFLSAADIRRIAEAVVDCNFSGLNQQQRAYLALRSIGRPAHFSEIAETFNQQWPEHYGSEHNVHAVLSRCSSPEHESYGIVWIGLRGTFALKEWGYERPSKGLFDAVTDIVKDKYEQTDHKPVPFTVIAAEIGKYRQVVNPTSLVIAAQCNPDLQRVLKDSFVPRVPEQCSKEEMKLEELDRILRGLKEDLDQLP